MSAEPLRVSCCLGADSGTVALSNIIIKQNKLMSVKIWLTKITRIGL